MIGSLYSGISGLKANNSALSVIGDNIANVDTTGFKASRVSFANVFSSSLGQSKLQIGRGVTMDGISANWGSGTLETTANVTDLAINGQGMFIVSDVDGSALYYTRAGQFEFDNEGYLVNSDSYQVQGYPIDTSGNVGALGAISLPSGMSEPSATTEITMGLNLDANASTDYETTVTVYDSLGNPVDLTFTFTRDTTPDLAGSVEWDYTVTTSNTSATITTASPATLGFTSSGALDPAATASGPLTVSATGDGYGHAITVTGLDPADTLSLVWRFTDTSQDTDGSVTSYSGTSIKNSQTQNGYPTGMLQGVSVDEDGVFTGLYSNGTMISFAQIALADFASYSGLMKQGSNMFTSSLASGQAIISTPNQGGVGAIAPSSLEMSNVDLATEFVEMITTQRAYQANSKVITTSDEILSELINMKR